MTAVETITRVLRSAALDPDLTVVPARGATDTELRDEQSLLGRHLSPEHVTLLRQWNGIDLEVLRFYGCGAHTGAIARLARAQVPRTRNMPETVAIGSDPSGFVYLQDAAGRVFSLDTDGGAVAYVGESLDDFVSRFVFGPDAARFGGDQWLQDLQRAGLVP